jgi:hypothetical protein
VLDAKYLFIKSPNVGRPNTNLAVWPVGQFPGGAVSASAKDPEGRVPVHPVRMVTATAQALVATYDNCSSLHTNAYDEAVTTPARSRSAPRLPSGSSTASGGWR